MASNKNNNHTVFRPSVFSREEIETDTVIHPEKLSRNKKGLYTGNKTDYTEEDIKNFKLINWKKAHPGVSIQNNAVASLDYSHIENDELRHSFIELCVDFESRKSIYNYNIINNITNDPVKCKAWYAWICNIEEKFGFVFRESYINFDERHFVIRPDDKNKIFISSEYILLGKKGKPQRWSNNTYVAMNNNNILDISEIYKVFGEHKNNMVQTQGISMDDIVKQYARLFKNILKGYNELMFDNLLWHVMKFTEQTIEISEFSISPRRIYQIVDYVYHEKTWRYPAQPHRKRLQKVFIEPGYPSNLYKEYVKKTKMLRIRNAFLMCKNLGIELNTDNLITQYALLNNKIKKSEINDGQLTKIQKSEFKRLLDEMLANKNNPEWKEIIEVPVRKNHKEWMDKLKELMNKEGNIDYQYFCDLYRGLIELPERKAFNKYKIKIKKTWK